MSDVLISYSQRAPATALVGRRYDPWYDVNLLPGQALARSSMTRSTRPKR